jgi:rhodanese-related sulfurtransferase
MLDFCFMRGVTWVVVAVLIVVGIGFIYYDRAPTTGAVIEFIGDYTDVSSAVAFDLISDNPDLLVIDVSPNYDDGHLPGAVNYYLGDGSLGRAIPMLNKNAMYLVYCHFESASRAGAQRLVDAGFSNVYRLEDDYGGWVAKGYPVEM